MFQKAVFQPEVPSSLLPSLFDVQQAAERISSFVERTPVQQSSRLSEQFGCSVFLKREDQQLVRSFKVRGALNKLLHLTPFERQRGVVCASAGNHAQGLAFACELLGVECVVFLPQNTPKQKVDQVRYFGKSAVEVVLSGLDFDQCCAEAKLFSEKKSKYFIHAFDDFHVIAGQGTLALELIEQQPRQLDYLFVPIGGGGLASGVVTVYRQLSPETKLIGVEVEGAAAMAVSLQQRRRVKLSELDVFADGTAVRQVGDLPFQICKDLLDGVLTVSRRDLSKVLIDLHNLHGMVVEPSGALSITALANMKFKLGQSVGCIVSGGNNDASRFAEYAENV